MQKKITHLLLTTMLLIFLTTKATAQWAIGGLSGTDLISSLSMPPLGTSYNNVIVSKHLAVNVNTTTCPLTTGTGSTDYPLVVNDISSDGSAIVLWDNGTTDPIRKIMGLSPAGGVAVFSGDNIYTGSGIVLNSPGTSSSPVGKVQVISNVKNASAPARAYELLNRTDVLGGSSTSFDNIFSIDQKGNTRITGKISLDYLGGDIAMRTIEGLSTLHGIDIYTGTAAAPGAGIEICAPGHPTTPGLMYFGAPGPLTGLGPAFDFVTQNAAVTTGIFSVMRINNEGRARIGRFGPPTASDRLTVDGNLYINSHDNNDATYRNIFAKTATSGLNVTSGQYTDGSDGACFNAYAPNVVATGGLYAPPYPGGFIIKSKDNQYPLGFGYVNRSGSGGSGADHNIFLASKKGQGCFGIDMNLSNIVNGDIFTVKQSLGFYSTNDSDPRFIHGETHSGNLSLSSYTDYTNGSAITLYGMTNATNPSEIHFSSAGNTGLLATFDNYTSGALHNNMQIGKNGHIVMGHDVPLSSTYPFDIVTVKDQLGFFSFFDYQNRIINGNTNSGSLGIYSTTASNDHSSVELIGATNTTPGWAGTIRYSSNGTTGDGHVFLNKAGLGGVHTNLTIQNNGRTIIGHDIPIASTVASDVLTVKDQIGFYTSTPNAGRNINGNAPSGVLSLHANTSSTNGACIEIYGRTWALPDPGSIHYVSDGAASDIGHEFLYYNGSTWLSRMRVYNNGAVVIGDNSVSTPNVGSRYSLYVQHGILTEHVHVALHSTSYWADYVFNKGYKLMPLAKVEEYVKEYNHLPGIPSAEEVVKDGIDVADIDAKLLKKIEELTLYVIQQEKRIDELQKKLEIKK